MRFLGFTGGGFVCYRDLDGIEGDELDALIARQVEVFAARGERFEWKLHGHDLPGDLPSGCVQRASRPRRSRPS